MNADNRVLESIIHCELLARCKAGEDLPCSKIVSVQDVPLREQQVPEPWTGHLDRARLVFISSNPSIDPREAYPRWGDDIAESVRYFTDRFDGGPGQIRDGIYSPLPDGGWSGAVRFWAAVRQRAFELIPDATPGVDYALTEVVHCKSQNEIGVAEARQTCAARYLPEVLATATEARVFAVIGVQAVREVSDLFGLELDGNNRFAQLEHERRRWTFVYLDHPSSGGKKKRFTTALTRGQLDRVRGELVVADLGAPLSAALAATSPETWDRLRELLQRVERYAPRFTSGDAARSTPSQLPATEANELVDCLYADGLMVPFDWSGWLEVVGPLDADPTARIAECTAEECLGYLTAIFRATRFVEGSFEQQFLDGYPQLILGRLLDLTQGRT